MLNMFTNISHRMHVPSTCPGRLGVGQTFQSLAWGKLLLRSPVAARQHARQQQLAAVAADDLTVWDVVEYKQSGTQSGEPGWQLRLGLVQQVEAGCIQLSPLIEEDDSIWVPEADDAEAPEEQQQVPLESVMRVVDSAYGQRQDKEHNPHGEHAHDIWQVLVPLSPGIYRGAAALNTSSGR